MQVKRFTMALLLVAAATAMAQDSALPEYQVEILVVRHLNPATGTEVFPFYDEREESEIPAERFSTLDSSAYALTPMVQKIGRSKNFKVLSHSGWVQPGYAREDARRKIFLRNSSGGESVSGHLILTRERYLRLALDLTLSLDGQTYYLQTQRRMISRQVHYFDHPYFGVIAKVTPL